MSIIAADTIKSRVAGAAVTTTGGLYVGGACTSISLNVTGIATIGVGLSFADSVKASFGNSNDLQIYHDPSNAFIANNGSGDFYIQGGNIKIRNVAGSANMAEFTSGQYVNLYYNNSKKFETHNSGVQITGDLDVTGIATCGILTAYGDAAVGSAITMYASSGIVSATAFYGDGSQLEGVSASGGGALDITSCLFI